MKYRPKIILGPGDSIREELEYYGWTQLDLAEILNISTKHMSHILNNKVPITIKNAKLLSKTFKQSPQYWLNMDANYRLQLQESTEEKVNEKAIIFRYMPINQMRKLDWIKTNRRNDSEALTKEVMEFWNINKLDFEFIEKRAAACFRKSAAFENFNPFYALTWLRKAQKEVETKSFVNYDFSRLKTLVEQVPDYTIMENGISQFLLELQKCCVIFLHLSHLERTYTDGASFFLNDNPVIIYTARHNRDDNFWFTITHEIGHVLLHLDTNDSFYIDSLEFTSNENSIESEANEFTVNILKYNSILDLATNYSNITRNIILSIKNELGISSSVIVGCLQFSQVIQYNRLNNFKSKVLEQL